MKLLSAAFAAILGALCSIVLLAVFYTLSPALEIDFAVDPPRLMTGVHPGERDEATQLTFAWTSRDLALRLPGLDRRVPWSVDIRVRGGRQNPAENPTMVFYVDGLRVLEQPSQTDFTDVRLVVPPRPDRPRGALVTMQVSSTFVPGAGDPRPLGVMLDKVTVRPDGLAVPPAHAFATAATSGAVLAAAVALLGVTPGSAIGAALLLAAGQGAILAKGFGPYTAFPDLAARLAIAIAIALVVVVFAIERIRGTPLRNTARFAAAFTAAALFLKLLVLLHPDMPLGDALFQAHRFQEVLRGNYYFTSIAPGNYLFPYAPGLYVAASPFAELVRREAGDVVLLRIVVATVDAIAGALLYFIVVRGWSDRRGAAIATALYQLLPLDFGIVAAGNLTNAFAQSLAVGGLAIVSASWLRLERVWSMALLTIVLAAAFLSHTSTFGILSVTAVMIAVMFAWRGGPRLRSPALAVLVGAMIAVACAVLLYYAHFIDTYRTELARIGGETATAAADAGGRGIGTRALLVPLNLHAYLGVPAILLAAWGTVSLWRRGLRDRLTLAVAGWGMTCVLFLVVGVLTPVDMRYYLASLPALAIVASAGASTGWAAGERRRLVAVALLAWAVWVGIATWWRVLG
jgi:hypothetical protein